jgi:hypothetical protein
MWPFAHNFNASRLSPDEIEADQRQIARFEETVSDGNAMARLLREQAEDRKERERRQRREEKNRGS